MRYFYSKTCVLDRINLTRRYLSILDRLPNEQSNLDRFIEQQKQLLKVEYDADIGKQSESQKLPVGELLKRGVCLKNLSISSKKTGIYARTVVKFCYPKTGSDKTYATHRITPRDLLGIGSGKVSSKNILSSGVVVDKNEDTITIAFQDGEAFVGDTYENYYGIKIINDVTYKKYKTALSTLEKYPPSGRAKNLIQVLNGDWDLSDPLHLPEPLKFFNKNLDDSQKAAIEFALKQRELAIIHGPPGTGKTTTLVEFIMQCAYTYNLKILVCGPSNIAIDNLGEKLVDYGVKNILRIGLPSRTLNEVKTFSFDEKLNSSKDFKIINLIRLQIDDMEKEYPRRKEAIGLFRKELKEREYRVFKKILEETQIVLSTLASGSPTGPLRHIINDPNHQFDVVVIDECSQSLEVACWITLPYAPKCVLAGDHLQLPPTIKSPEAAKDGLSLTIMERLIKLFGPSVSIMLDTQYRMNKKIMSWSSKNLYSGKLLAHESVANITLSDLSVTKKFPPLVLIDTSGCDMEELSVEDENSKGNANEADIIAIYADILIDHELKAEHIGIITPYSLQVELLKSRIHRKHPGIEINSIDGFQGREKEVIILSLVRSNVQKELGFLTDFRRLNVAITRAKRHLVCVCDTRTMSSDDHLKSFIDYLFNNGKYISARVFKKKLNTYKSSQAQRENVQLLNSINDILK